MSIKHFPPPPGVKAPPLSFAARTGDLLYISGIPGFDENRALPDSFEAQFRNVVTNIKRVLDEAGGTFRDLVKVNVLLTRASDVAAMNALYAGAFGPRPTPPAPPAWWMALPDPKMLIEIEAVAQLRAVSGWVDWGFPKANRCASLSALILISGGRCRSRFAGVAYAGNRAVQGGASRREAAELYGISPSVVVIWMQRWMASGSIEARPSGGSAWPLDEHAVFLGLTVERPDMTLDEIVAAMARAGIAGIAYRLAVL